MEYFGTEMVGGVPALTLEERLGRCYELAGYALSLTTSVPSESLLVHGSIWGVRAPRRIDHAWLLIDDRSIWEPATGAFYDLAAWKILARPEITRTYTGTEVRTYTTHYGHWGPWEPLSNDKSVQLITDVSPKFNL